MMSKTHLSIGIALSLITVRPETTGLCLATLAGASIGSIISDIDTRSNRYFRDALYGRIIAIAMVAISIIVDLLTGGTMLHLILAPNRRILEIIGSCLLILVCIFGAMQSHRTFTHSLLCLVIMSVSIYLICPTMTCGFVVGFVSHILLDIVNKQPVKVLYPYKKGICFGWCYASKKANLVLMIIGFISSAVLFGYFFVVGVGITKMI